MIDALESIGEKVGFEVPGWVYSVRRRVKNFYYWFLYRLHQKHRYHIVRTGLPPGYYDQDTRMLHACMALLGDWIEESGGVEKVAEFSRELRAEVADKERFPGEREMHCDQAGRQEEALAIHHWWMVERPQLESDKEKAIDDWHDSEFQAQRPPGKRWEVANELEKKLAEDDQAYLHRLIALRPFLWV